MKLNSHRSQITDLPPFLITNSGLLSRKLGLVRPVRWDGLKVPDIILNGNLLGLNPAHYGVTTAPGESPCPADVSFGVEALDLVSEATRKAANTAAVSELLSAAPDLSVLRAYSGGGSIGESINEYYTPRDVADAMWLAAGPTPEGSRVLDPACGTGAILARAPSGLRLCGVELSRTSAAIARQCLPHAEILSMPFETFHTTCTDALYDKVLLNPPFGIRGWRHLDDTNEGRNEAYFLKTALGRVRYQHGVVVALVNLNIAGEASHRALREALSQYGQVVHTIAVPAGAFKKAGTDVSTVILTIRRHDLGVSEALGTLTPDQRRVVLDGYQERFVQGEMVYARVPLSKQQQLRRNDGQTEAFVLVDSFSSNRFLARHTDLNFGRFDQVHFPGDVLLDAARQAAITSNVKQALAGRGVTLSNVLQIIRVKFGQDAHQRAFSATEKASYQVIAAGTRNKEGTFVMTAQGWQPTDDFARADVADAIQVANAVQRVLQLQNQGQPSVHARKLALALDHAYRLKHGAYPRRLGRLAGRFSNLALLLAHDKDGGLVFKGTQDTPLHCTGTTQEIAAQLADLMMLTEQSLTEHAQITPAQAEQVLFDHYCFTGELWVSEGLYYAGNAYTKSEHARRLAGQFSGLRQQALMRQSRAFLGRLVPATLDEINLSPRDPVVPVRVLEAWVNARLGSIRNDKHLLSVTRQHQAIKIEVMTDQGHDNLMARQSFEISEAKQLSKYLNFKSSLDIASKEEYQGESAYQRARSIAMSEAAEYEERARNHFQTWLSASSHAQEVIDSYNRHRRSHLMPAGSGEKLPIEWHGPEAHPYQNADVRTFASLTGAVNGYAVGLGKTYSMLLLIGYLLKLSLLSRPVIVAPSGLVANAVNSALLCFPHWKVLSIGMTLQRNPDGTPRQKRRLDGQGMVNERGEAIYEWKNDSAAERRLKLGQLAAGEGDLVVMSREVFTSIPLCTETLDELIASDVQLNARQESSTGFDARGERGRHDTLKRIESFRAKVASRIKAATLTDLTFEALGIDGVFFDESQSYKNFVSAPSSLGNEKPKFIGGGAESNRAMDAIYKSRYIRSKGGRTYGYTASWVENSPLEAHTSMNLICDDLDDYGLPTVEALMEQYLQIEPRIITTLDGDVQVKPAVVAFQRLRELKGVLDSKIIVRENGDPEVVTAKGVPVHEPRLNVIETLIDMSPEQAEYYAQLRAQARSAKSQKGADHHFSVMWRMRKTTLDPVLMNLGGLNPRYEKIADIALEQRQKSGKTLVFISIGDEAQDDDLGQPQGGTLTRLRETLIRRGYPAAEIEIVTSQTHPNSVAKKDVEDRYNFGGVTLIIGSECLAKGFNLQIGTTAIIHGDILWNWQTMNQRNGRAKRQGNTNAQIDCYYLLMRGSFDVLTYTLLSGKKAWEDHLRSGVDRAENGAAGFNADEIALMMSDDPEATRQLIALRRDELSELSGRAAHQRRIQELQRAVYAANLLESVIKTADARKKGWTALDHLRVSQQRRQAEHARQAVMAEKDFPLGRLINYRRTLSWELGLPFHPGLSFRLEDVRWTVQYLDRNAVSLINPVRETRSLTFRDAVTLGRDFEPSSDPGDYRAWTVPDETAVQLIWTPDARLSAYDGRRVNPEPRSGQVMTVSVFKGRVEAISGASADHLRAHLSLGRTLIHYLTHEDGGQVMIEHVVILAPDQRSFEQTDQAIKANPDVLRGHMDKIMLTALAG